MNTMLVLRRKDKFQSFSESQVKFGCRRELKTPHSASLLHITIHLSGLGSLVPFSVPSREPGYLIDCHPTPIQSSDLPPTQSTWHRLSGNGPRSRQNGS